MTGWPVMVLPDVNLGLCLRDVSGVKAPSDLDGLVLPGFSMERLVAVGGMGLVVAAREIATGRVYALKTLQARFARDAGIVARFEREARFAKRVVHPHVPTVLGFGRLADGRPCYWMELFRGRTLRGDRAGGRASRDRAGRGDRRRRALRARGGACGGSRAPRRHAGERLVVPGPRGEERVLLLDFGFAHEPGVDTGDGLTAESRGALVGTAAFMAPEQVMRARAILPQTDLFAAGLLLYYALTGRLPFPGDDAVAMLRRQPVPLRAVRAGVPRALDTFVHRALEKHRRRGSRARGRCARRSGACVFSSRAAGLRRRSRSWGRGSFSPVTGARRHGLDRLRRRALCEARHRLRCLRSCFRLRRASRRFSFGAERRGREGDGPWMHWICWRSSIVRSAICSIGSRRAWR